MKKMYYAFLAGAIALTSCNKDAAELTPSQEDRQIATFTIQAPVATRSTVTDLTRYIVEAYENKDLGQTPVRVESSAGTLIIELKKNTEYTFLFWADKGTIGGSENYYNAAKLQDVSINESVAGTTVAIPGYCHMRQFNTKDIDANKTITLKNATAQVNFIESAGFVTQDNQLKIKYSNSYKLNVGTGAITKVPAEITRTYKNIAMIAKDALVVSDYVLAPLSEKNLIDLQITFNDEPEKSVNNIPLQQNYKTNIKGEYSNLYSSELTVSNQVEDLANNQDVKIPETLKIGSFYYSDGTWSTQKMADKTCIGIVFYVNPDRNGGKIVGLDEPIADWNGGTNAVSSLQWTSLTTSPSVAKDRLNGLSNMAAISAIEGWKTTFPAFAWCDAKNVPNTDYSKATKGVWYLPAVHEQTQLMAGMCGLKWIASGTPAPGEIVDWASVSENAMPNYANYVAVRERFNMLFDTVGGTPIFCTEMDKSNYWSSTEISNPHEWSVNFNLGKISYGTKDYQFKVRAIATF